MGNGVKSENAKIYAIIFLTALESSFEVTI